MRFTTKNAVAFIEPPTIDEVKNAPREHKIGFNDYNYCGAGTLYHLKKSGKYEMMMDEAGKKKIGKPPYKTPRNALDNACEKHDKVYADKEAELDEVRNADIVLKKSALQIAKKSKNIGEKVRAGMVAGAMFGKTKLEDAGAMKKGSYSSASEIRKKYLGGEVDTFRSGGIIAPRKTTQIRTLKKGGDVRGALTKKQEANLNDGLKKSLRDRHERLITSGPIKEAILKRYCKKK